MALRHPNLLFVFGDQWRAQACGYAGDPNVQTPCIDRFAAESVNLGHAVAGWPVCSPYRASLLTGQYPLTHGVMVNDQHIHGQPVSIAHALGVSGYATGYIGKWHINGRGRSKPVPPADRLGFAFWRGYECTHDYNHSPYYTEDGTRRFWDGYDAEAQTREACRFVETRDPSRPFCLFLSWGPPHNPYETAPERFRQLYDPARIQLRPNVPPDAADAARADLAGYYAHCSALDACFGGLLETLDRTGAAENTIVVFTSDHGDMLGSHGLRRKQWPYDESIRVPFLIRGPSVLGSGPRTVTVPVNAPDILPTLLSLCGVPVPATSEGTDFSAAIRDGTPVDDDGALLACYFPFHECHYRTGGRDYRGLRTARHTYVRDRRQPWFLFDNDQDPYQMRNLADDPGSAELRVRLDALLQSRLSRCRDTFEPGWRILRRFDVTLTEQGDDVYYER
jgi:arylsulfatase A-like enzyme